MAGRAKAFMPRWYSMPSLSTSVSMAARATRIAGADVLTVTSAWMMRPSDSGSVSPYLEAQRRSSRLP